MRELDLAAPSADFSVIYVLGEGLNWKQGGATLPSPPFFVAFASFQACNNLWPLSLLFAGMEWDAGWGAAGDCPATDDFV